MSMSTSSAYFQSMAPTANVSDNESDPELSNNRRHSESTQILRDRDEEEHYARAHPAPIRPKESCACCFSTRTGLLAVLITIAATILFIVVVDVVIMEVERETRYQAMKERSTWNYNDGVFNETAEEKLEYTFIMNGTEDADTMEQFVSIPNKWEVIHVKLSNVEINPATLSHELGYLGRLKSITMVNVTLFGRMGVLEDIHLPRLNYYKLELNQPIGPRELLRFKNRNCAVSDLASALTFSTFQHKDCLKSLIFFRTANYRVRSWSIEHVYRLNATIHITLFGFHLFTLDKNAGELTSVLDYSQEILENLLRDKPSYFKLRKLNLRTCPLKLSVLAKFSDQLTHLHLGSINFNESDPNALSNTIGKFKQLERFYFMGSGNFPREMEQMDLVDITTNVRELRLGLVEINYRNSITTTITKFALNHLYLHHIGIKNPEIIIKFHQIFDTKRIFFDGKNFGVVPFSRFEFWLNVMKMPSVEFVLFDDSTTFPFLGRVSPGSEQFMTPTVNATVQSKLAELGVSLDINKAFVLKKNPVTGKWEGRNYDSTNDKDTFALFIEGGNVDETFINIDTFLKLRFPGAASATTDM